ncbi:hypothetical protein Taro_048700 [Colocasia esculenta]|uniref:Uncharacterized protein n=1 Tax=Colocasia esculenta TaxID=4460 RepID=A0A843X8V2_COLES|nr:hypothetical protein [Colocasia esculenta]
MKGECPENKKEKHKKPHKFKKPKAMVATWSDEDSSEKEEEEKSSSSESEEICFMANSSDGKKQSKSTRSTQSPDRSTPVHKKKDSVAVVSTPDKGIVPLLDNSATPAGRSTPGPRHDLANPASATPSFSGRPRVRRWHAHLPRSMPPNNAYYYHHTPRWWEGQAHRYSKVRRGSAAVEAPVVHEEQPPVQEEQPPVQEDQPPAPEDQPQVHEDQPPINEDQPHVAAQVDEPFIAPHSPQLQPSSSMNLETEIPSFSPQPLVHASTSFGGPSVPPKLYTFLNDKFDALNTSIKSMSENFELRIQRLENTVSAKFIEQKAASDHATQRFNRLIGTLVDASVDLKEHQEKLETVLKGILANSQANVFNTKETLSQISKTRLSFAHLVDDLESMKNLSAHIDEEMSALKREFKGQTFSCKGSVDTTINGVDTMAQSKGRNVKKRLTSVDTSPGQVDTRDRSQRNMLTGFHLSLGHGVDTESSQVDTRDLSQGIDLLVWDSVSTHLMGRSTHSGISVT